MSATISKDQVVSFHYTLTSEEKEVLDSSEGSEPLIYLHGHSQIIPGLEKALDGKKVGDKMNVIVEPSEGYGEYHDDLTKEVPKSMFPRNAPLEVGAMFEFSNADGEPVVVRIVEVIGENVKVDGNHPLAGKKLFFAVEVVSFRAATKEELEHGHAHGADGHGGHDH